MCVRGGVGGNKSRAPAFEWGKRKHRSCVPRGGGVGELPAVFSGYDATASLSPCRSALCWAFLMRFCCLKYVLRQGDLFSQPCGRVRTKWKKTSDRSMSPHLEKTPCSTTAPLSSPSRTEPRARPEDGPTVCPAEMLLGVCVHRLSQNCRLLRNSTKRQNNFVLSARHTYLNSGIYPSEPPFRATPDPARALAYKTAHSSSCLLSVCNLG